MNENDQELVAGLRCLSADCAREAPASIEERLISEFRRRIRRRRIAMWASGTGVAAVAAGLFVMTWLGAGRGKPPVPTISQNGYAPAMIEVSGPPGVGSMRFYELPEASELPPVEDATVVRVQLPMASLRLIGFQVSEDRINEAVQADVLLGQDGLARGVRVVQ